jgi:hypothetical protein
MKRARFVEEQIIGVLREHEAAAKTADLAHKHGVSEGTLYNRKAKYGGMVGYLTPATHMPPTSTQRAIGCATRTSSADRTLLYPRQTAQNPPRL